MHGLTRREPLTPALSPSDGERESFGLGTRGGALRAYPGLFSCTPLGCSEEMGAGFRGSRGLDRPATFYQPFGLTPLLVITLARFTREFPIPKRLLEDAPTTPLKRR